MTRGKFILRNKYPRSSGGRTKTQYSNNSHLLVLVRFKGVKGSLEITAGDVVTHTQIRDALLGPSGAPSSHSPRLENARELHIVGCFFGDAQGSRQVSTTIPNLVFISFFHSGGPNPFGLLTPTDPSSLPFRGVEVKTLVIGRGPGEFKDDHPEDPSALGEFVDDLRIGCPAKTLEWGAWNDILNIWSTVEVPSRVSPDGGLVSTDSVL